MDESKLKQFVTLLAQSTMEQKMKDAIMSNLEALSVEEFENLLLALQNEEKALRKISGEIDATTEKQEDDWEEVRIKQKETAEAIISSAATQLGEEAAAQTIRKSLE